MIELAAPAIQDQPHSGNLVVRESLVEKFLRERDNTIDASGFVEEETCCYGRLVFPGHPDVTSLIRERIHALQDRFDIGEESSRMQFCMALEEAITNAIYHGSLDLDSSLKENDDDSFLELAQERVRLSPWRDRQVTADVYASRLGLWVTFTDEGAGYDVKTRFEMAVSPDPNLASGRGLTLILAFADEVFSNPVGNQITLVHYA